MLILNSLIGFGAGGGPGWKTLGPGDWLGDTGSFTLGDGTVTANSADRNIRTGIIVGENRDFVFSLDVAGAAGFVMGFATEGSATGTSQPTTANPVIYAKNQGTGPGWNNNSGSVEAARSAGWCAGRTIGIRRQGASLYGHIDGAVDHGFSVSTGAAGLVFLGCDGSGSGWSAGNVRITFS